MRWKKYKGGWVDKKEKDGLKEAGSKKEIKNRKETGRKGRKERTSVPIGVWK